MRDKAELSRLTVLQNFKEINRIMTHNFLKNKELSDKFSSRIPDDVHSIQSQDNKAASVMTSVMKQM
jgi:hypothetical protein